VLLKLSLLCLTGAVLLSGQTPTSPEIFRARQVVTNLRAQVNAGVAPRQLLEQAEDALADAQDAELLNQMLGIGDLTEDQARELIEAAQRRLNHAQANIERQQRLVDLGAEAAQTVTGLTQEREWAQQQYELAASRADLVYQVAEMARTEQQMPEPASVSTAPDRLSLDQPAM